jgi:uncharacterized protein (DUF362 family)
MKTTPASVLSDYRHLLTGAGYTRFLPSTQHVLLKLNLSWSLFFPGCSSPPWQVEGVLSTVLQDGYEVTAVENKTVVTDPEEGAMHNRWSSLFSQYDVQFIPLQEAQWIDFTPHSDMMAMGDIFPEGFQVPHMFMDTSIIHLPTLKTHGHTVITGAVKNAFGGLLKERRHHAHTRIHEILVDLMLIQKEIHSGIFAVMDGTICGDGAGPRTLIPRVGNLLLASEDQVALDTVAATLMGFDPLSIPFIRLCHERGIGMGDFDQIEIMGDDISSINFHCSVHRSPVIFFDQLLRTSMCEPLFHTPLFRAAIAASAIYHDVVWYPLVGRRRVNHFMKTPWGELFSQY